MYSTAPSRAAQSRSEDFTRFTFALPDDLRDRAERVSREDDVTLAQLCRRGLRLALAQREAVRS
jgi:hypothetical protein